MEELHVQFADRLSLVANPQDAVVGECPDDRGFDLFIREDSQHGLEPFRRHGEDHAFLGFRYPDFVVAQSGVFERDVVKIDDRSQIRPHLPDRTAEPTGAAVGHGRVEATVRMVTGQKQGIQQLLFLYGMSDLHGVRELLGVCLGQLR